MKGSEKAQYSFVPSKYFSFYVQNNLINGNYYTYEKQVYDNMRLEKNLALDYVGRFMYGKYLNKKSKFYNENFVKGIAPIISDITVFENYILTNQLPSSSGLTERQLLERYPNFIIDCKNVFNRELNKWNYFIIRLSQKGIPN